MRTSILGPMTRTVGREGPFRPGPGRLPPYLAGREAEQALFRGRLADLAERLAPPSEIILCGPRGNGKTALLFWLEEEAASSSGVEALRITPSAIPTVSQLISRLTPWWKRLAPRDLAAWGISLKLGGEPAAVLDRALESRARWKPLVLLLDEAHTLDAEVGRALLNASQQVGGRSPFQLVLAGTPDLESRLRLMSASFWSRAEQIRINLLDDEAAADAIRKPLEANGFSIGDEPLASIVRESQGYPWFLQLWGKAVWRETEGAGPGRRVTGAVVEAARTLFEEQKILYYRQRYNELKEQGLLSPAREVAETFKVRRRLDDAALDRAVRRGLGAAGGTTDDEAARVQTALGHLGYVWQSGSGLEWEAGIPSLMEFVSEHAPAG